MFDVSVIIVSYNTKDLTLQCIESVKNDGSSIKKEIIVVDNGSNDGSSDALRESITRKEDILIENKTNVGFSKANNQALRIAKGKYMLLLNSDTLVKRRSIEKLVNFAERNNGVLGAAVPKLLNPDGTTQASVFRFPTFWRVISQYWLGRRGLLDKYYPTGRKPTQVEVAVMSAFLITPKALKEVGFLDERYFMYFEDFDYCRRIKEAGLKIYYLPTAEVIHHHGASGRGLADYKNQWRRLIPSSKIYHGIFKHYLFNFIIWSGQKWQKLFR